MILHTFLVFFLILIFFLEKARAKPISARAVKSCLLIGPSVFNLNKEYKGHNVTDFVERRLKAHFDKERKKQRKQSKKNVDIVHLGPGKSKFLTYSKKLYENVH